MRNILKEKSFQFAVTIVNLYKELCSNNNEYILSKQLLRSGTSIGANIREANNAESLADFIHKLSISQKECDETLYWLDLLHATDYINTSTHLKYNSDCSEILKIFRSSIITSKNKIKNNS